MRSQWIIGLAVAILSPSVSAMNPAGAEEPPQDRATMDSRTSASAARTLEEAIKTGLSFLTNDALKWRADRGCATCHHGTMTVWALSEAKAQGHSVEADVLDEIVQWTKERMVPRIATVRDPRPGWRLVGIPAVYLSVMSQNLPVRPFAGRVKYVGGPSGAAQRGGWLRDVLSQGIER
jgi:hypothetical protein